MKRDLHADLIAEGIYSDPAVMRRDMEDDLVDQATGAPPAPAPINRKPRRIVPDEEMVDLRLAAAAVQNPGKAAKVATESPGYRNKLLASLQALMKTASGIQKQLATLPAPAPAKRQVQPTHEAVSMGVGSSQVRGGPEGDAPGAGTGIPIKRPVVRKKMAATRMNFGSPADGGMVGTNPMIPGRSAFSKGIG